jgi:hypothetical protein
MAVSDDFSSRNSKLEKPLKIFADAEKHLLVRRLHIVKIENQRLFKMTF